MVRPRVFGTRVALVCAALVPLVVWIGVVWGVEWRMVLTPATIQSELGNAYVAPVPRVNGRLAFRGDTGSAPFSSTLQLFEGERRLGPAHALHDEIRQLGSGRFSHWGEVVYFAASDNTDATRNGRAYVAAGRIHFPVWTGYAVTLVSVALVLALRRRRIADDGVWLRTAVIRGVRASRHAVAIAAGVVTLVAWVGALRGIDHSFVLEPKSISRDSGHAYVVAVPTVAHCIFSLRGDRRDSRSRAALTVHEDERLLGPGRAFHDDIRQRGAGRFSHWDHAIYFSASDNTDPARNGRTYRVVARARLPLWIAFTALMLFGWVLLVRRRWELPALHHPALTRATCALLLIAITAHLPALLADAARADAKLNHAIPFAGDDPSYQVLALNVLHGRGYSTERLLPFESYRIDATREAVDRSFPDPALQFRRSPGFSLMLAATYAFFGTETIVAHRMMAVLTWLTALLLLVTGATLAGWIGSIAGGLTALYHLNYFPGTYQFERLLSENPTAFWVALFGLVFTRYLQRPSVPALVCSALTFAGIVLMRANFVLVLPLLVLYLVGLKNHWRTPALFAAVALLPLLAWSGYASLAMRRPVFLTMAGQTLFANTNNPDTLDGIGGGRWNQGGWNPGFLQKPDGTWEKDLHNQIKAGENGWSKGLTFWRNNLSRLPELFYVKLRAGFWFAAGDSSNWLRPEGFFLVGIGYLLMALGFLPVIWRPAAMLPLSAEWLLAAQLLLLASLLVLWNTHGLLPVLIVWLAIFGVSVLRLSGRQEPLPFPNPVWFLAFVGGHFVTTVVFYGIRFHLPLDANLMLIAALGILLTMYETARRGWLLHVSFTTVIVFTILMPLS